MAATSMESGAHEPVLAFAQVELGGMVVGIPAGSVQRAIPRPAQLARLPRSGRAIEGVFEDGGRTVPLVDLRRWMDSPAEGEPAHVIVLGAHGRTVGLAVDAIRGLVRVPGSRIHKVQHDDAPDGFFHSVATLDDGAALISLLDPPQLMAQVQAWTQEDACAGDGGQAPGSRGDGARANAPLFAQIRIGETVLAVPAGHVGEVVGKPQVHALDLGGSPVNGMMQWRGAQVPVLAGGAAIGLAGQGTAHASALKLVLSDGELHVALPADEVVSVHAIDLQTILPAAQAGLDAAGFFGGLARGANGQPVLVLDTGALLAAFAVRGLADADDGTALQVDNARIEAHIAFDIGQDWAIAMRSVLEIVDVPDGLAALPGAADGVIGNVDWRGRVLPVLDARRGAAVRPDARARLMVVQHGERTAALLVNDLVALLPQQGGSSTQFMLAGRERVRMITVGQPGARTSYRLMEPGALPFFAA